MSNSFSIESNEQRTLTHSDRLQILLTWAKAKEGKKILRSKTIVTEEIV
jgi:L-lactate utilization protein LutB